MSQSFKINEIGEVSREKDSVVLKVLPEFRDAMKGLDMFSHVSVLWWGNRDYIEENRSKMTLNPPYAPDTTLGLFATRAEYHPNPICLTACPVLRIDVVKGEIEVANIDADDKTPIIDIKGYYPVFDRVDNARIPDWGFQMPEAVPEAGVEIWE